MPCVILLCWFICSPFGASPGYTLSPLPTYPLPPTPPFYLAHLFPTHTLLPPPTVCPCLPHTPICELPHVIHFLFRHPTPPPPGEGTTLFPTGSPCVCVPGLPSDPTYLLPTAPDLPHPTPPLAFDSYPLWHLFVELHRTGTFPFLPHLPPGPGLPCPPHPTPPTQLDRRHLPVGPHSLLLPHVNFTVPCGTYCV